MKHDENRLQQEQPVDRYRVRVLVVDEDAASRKLLTTLAEQAGCEAIAACDLEAGLILVEAGRPDIVIGDWARPGGGGLEQVRQLRDSTVANCPYLILATAQADEDVLAEAFGSGIDDFIGKPLKEKIVAARLLAGQRMVRLQRDNQERIDQLRQYTEELARSNQRLQALAVTDELTGLPNRRYAMERMHEEWSAADRQQSPLSCLVIDLDGFKQLNDTYGHQNGDTVLKAVAAALQEAVRGADTVCRIGGDEFLVICPGLALEAALACGDRLVRRIEALGVQAARTPFGLSIGAAERRPGMRGTGDLIQVADQGMYLAKYNGRNQVCSCQDLGWNWKQPKRQRLVRLAA